MGVISEIGVNLWLKVLFTTDCDSKGVAINTDGHRLSV
jgi:hypothetical protein